MKKHSRFLKIILITSCLALLGACGLAASSEERIARAGAEMEAGDYRAAMIELKNALGRDADNVGARLMLAKVSLGLGDVLSAEKELARAVDLAAPESEVRPLHLQILLTKGEFTEVLAALGMETTGLTVEQQWSYRGEALLALGNSDTAKETYLEWLDFDPTSIEAAVGLAKATAATGDLEEAITRLGKLVQVAPTDFAVWHSLGLAQFRSGDYAGAESSLSNAVDNIKPQSNIPRYAVMLAALTEVQLVLDKRDAARRSLERLSGVAPNSPMTLLLAARLARAEGDYALASRHLQTLLNVSPDNTQAQLFLANMQMMQGNFAQAESVLQRVIARAPENLQARKLLAQVQLQQSQPAGAIEALAPLLESDSQDSSLYTILAQASLQQGDSAEAIRRFRTATELAPDDVEAKLNLAAAYLDAGETTLAMEVLDGVPNDTGAAFRRERLLMAGLVGGGKQEEADAIAEQLLTRNDEQGLASAIVAEHYLRTGRSEEARGVLRELVAANPELHGAKIGLARVEFAEGNADKAIELFSLVLAADESNLDALVGLAGARQQEGETEQARELLEQAATAHNEAIAPRALLARLYLAEGKVVEAERMANELVAIGFRNPNISAVVAAVFADAGRNEDALFQFQQAVDLDPESSAIQLGLARFYLALDRSVDAKQALKRALEITPGWPPAMTLLALVEIRQGRINDARQLIAEFREMNPDNVTGMVLEGELHLYEQEFALAAAAFRRAANAGGGRPAVLREYQANVQGVLPNSEAALLRWLETNPDDTTTRSFLAQHYQQSNDGANAMREYERILKDTPDNPAILNNLAWQYQQKGDLDQALGLAERAYALQPDIGSIVDTLAWIHYDRGELDRGLELLAEASRLSPNNGEIQYHYAVALSDSGDRATAKQILQQLIEKDAKFSSRELAEALLRQL